MTVPTFLIGILPTYNSWGIIAPLLLIGLRLIQGFAAGGELPVSAAYVYQLSNNITDKNLLCSLVNAGGLLGIIMASLLVLLLNGLFNESIIINWAWRLPFLLGLALSVMIFYFRKNIIMNSQPQDAYCADSENKPNKSILFIVLQAMMVITFLQVSFYLLFIWMPIYLEQFCGVEHYKAKLSNMITLISLLFIIIFSGYLGKFINYKKLIMLGILLISILSYPLFKFLYHADFYSILFIQLLFVLAVGPIQGNYIFALGKMFNGRMINRAMALSFTIPTALFGGTAPFICSYFIYKYGCINFPSFYIIFFSLITIPFAWLL